MPVGIDVAGVILAGGRGTRMDGADKGLVIYQQRPLIEWMLERVRPQVNEILISANRNLDVYAKYGCRVLPDTLPDYPGPLAGVLTAMEAVSTEWLFVGPCDAPHLPADLVRHLWRAAQANHAPLAVAADAARTHYSIMLVQPRLADSLREYLAAGQHAIHRWQQTLNPARHVFSGHMLANLNTPTDLIDL